MKIHQDIIGRIIKGEATEAEQLAYFEHLENNKEEKEAYIETRNLWVKTSMYDRIDPTEMEKGFNQYWNLINRSGKKVRQLTMTWLQYAAVIAIVITVGGLGGYFLKESISPQLVERIYTGAQKFSAQKGSIAVFELADGSKIWLNSGSELSYYNDPFTNERLADLQGEGYFEVKHDDESPFVVSVGELVIHDLGTTFNIKAYDQDDYIETTLVEGEVMIKDKNKRDLTGLQPLEQAYYDRIKKSLTISKIDPASTLAWKDGKFMFVKIELRKICEELSKWYDVEFVFENSQVGNQQFTIKNVSRSTTIDQLLKMMRISTGLTYTVESTTLGKDKIIIH
ncbi:FecR family protein [Puteibacter caeruleilacunae]|nr:FecR family protein [Puteibacter caeruleilacunae]